MPSEVAGRVASLVLGDVRAGSSVAAQTSREQINGLTGLRFMAAMMVVLVHVYSVIPTGYIGVSCFFILSGFILTYTYLTKTPLTGEHRWRFWVARFARIYPVYLIGILVAAHGYLSWNARDPSATGGNPWVALVASLGLVQSWNLSTTESWNGAAWSLSVEAFFYLVFPFVGLFLIRWKARRLLVSAVGFWLLFLCLVIAYFAVFPLARGGMESISGAAADWNYRMYRNPLVRLPEFLIGMAIGRIFVLQAAKSTTGRIGRWLASVALVVALVGIIVSLYVGPHSATIVTSVVADPFFALLIYSLAWSRGGIARVFSLPFVVLLGESSYALYLIHLPLWKMTLSVTARFHLSLWESAALAMSFIASVVILSILIFRYVEQPARAQIRSMYERWRIRAKARARVMAT